MISKVYDEVGTCNQHHRHNQRSRYVSEGIRSEITSGLSSENLL